MYLQHFNLKRQPFAAAPDPRLFYEGSHYADVLNDLEHSINSADCPVVKLMGEPGVGKSIAIAHLRQRLVRQHKLIEIKQQRDLNADNLLNFILFELELTSVPVEEGEAISLITKWFNEPSQRDHKLLLIMDDADELSAEAIDVLEKIAGISSDKGSNFCSLLTGEMLPNGLGNIQLSRLESLPEKFVKDYLNTRVELAGREGPALFDDEAAQTIAKQANGNPALINALAHKMLHDTFKASSDSSVQETQAQTQLAQTQSGQSQSSRDSDEPKEAHVKEDAWSAEIVQKVGSIEEDDKDEIKSDHLDIMMEEALAEIDQPSEHKTYQDDDELSSQQKDEILDVFNVSENNESKRKGVSEEASMSGIYSGFEYPPEITGQDRVEEKQDFELDMPLESTFQVEDIPENSSNVSRWVLLGIMLITLFGAALWYLMPNDSDQYDQPKQANGGNDIYQSDSQSFTSPQTEVAEVKPRDIIEEKNTDQTNNDELLSDNVSANETLSSSLSARNKENGQSKFKKTTSTEDQADVNKEPLATEKESPTSKSSQTQDKAAKYLSAANNTSGSQKTLEQGALDRLEEWLSTADDDEGTVQLLLVKAGEGSQLEEYLQRLSKTLDINDIMVYPTIKKGVAYYGVVYKQYPSRGAAYRDLASVEASVPYLGKLISRSAKGIFDEM